MDTSNQLTEYSINKVKFLISYSGYLNSRLSAMVSAKWLTNQVINAKLLPQKKGIGVDINNLTIFIMK